MGCCLSEEDQAAVFQAIWAHPTGVYMLDKLQAILDKLTNTNPTQPPIHSGGGAGGGLPWRFYTYSKIDKKKKEVIADVINNENDDEEIIMSLLIELIGLGIL